LCKNNKLGHVVNIKDGSIHNVRCKKYSCRYCRGKNKYQIYLETLKNVYSFNLRKHFVITFGGKEQRDRFNYVESYYKMSEEWNKFKQVIEYKYGRINYILFPRSQGDGYCHYHIITDKYLDWYFLDRKRKKYDLGFLRINENQDLAEYLCKDFFKDHEWIIPQKIKHYRSSRSIKIKNYESSDYQYFNFQTTIDQINYFCKELFGIVPDISSLNNELLSREHGHKIEVEKKLDPALLDLIKKEMLVGTTNI
jgi:hypothetical protein